MPPPVTTGALLLKNNLMAKEFPNSFTSWQETHFEIVQAITLNYTQGPSGVVRERHESQGHGGLYELAEELTDEFELKNEFRQWDGEFFDEIELFIKQKI
jgi:hypothetical protein